ncbi:MAG: PD-(D/E)XK nuclease family protein, partial [Alphaproteobacteria bacterium]|nr:PD-(D/E)XK nuclease family protein [Alphaproteobacteria bacterium]
EQNVNQAYLINTMQTTLRDLNASASLIALLRPKMENVARFIIERQKEKAPLLDTTFVETSGSFDFKLDDGTLFTLTAKADRIDVINDGSVEIIDYKTGTLPSQTDIKKGY